MQHTNARARHGERWRNASRFTIAGMKHRNPPRSDALDALASLNLLAGYRRRELAPLARNADLIDVPAGYVAEQAGARARQFAGIIDGYVRGVATDGAAVVLGPGEQFGAAELLDREQHAMTLTSVTPTRLVVVFGPAFRGVASQLPGVQSAARNVFRARTRSTTERRLAALAR